MSKQVPDPSQLASLVPGTLLPRVGEIVDDAAGLLHADGKLTRGKGMITRGVLAFLFPQYLTTPELRKA